VREHHIYKQARRGRPGPNTSYRKITKRRFDIEWTTDQDAIAYDPRSDGMYPPVTTDRAMSPAQVLEAHKGQPHDREALRADQNRARDRSGAAQERGAYRSALYPLFSRASRASHH